MIIPIIVLFNQMVYKHVLFFLNSIISFTDLSCLQMLPWVERGDGWAQLPQSIVKCS